MFQKDEKLHGVINVIKKDKNAVNELNYEQLVRLQEYLEEYKQYLLKKVGDK